MREPACQSQSLAVPRGVPGAVQLRAPEEREDDDPPADVLQVIRVGDLARRVPQASALRRRVPRRAALHEDVHVLRLWTQWFGNIVRRI